MLHILKILRHNPRKVDWNREIIFLAALRATPLAPSHWMFCFPVSQDGPLLLAASLARPAARPTLTSAKFANPSCTTDAHLNRLLKETVQLNEPATLTQPEAAKQLCTLVAHSSISVHASLLAT